MSKTVIAVLGVSGMSIFVVMSLIMVVIGMNNSAVRMEKSIMAQYEQNQNSRSQYVNSIAEAVQIPEMYKDDFKEVIQADMEGRYGKNGSKATFQWIKERNLDFNSELYTKLQTMIEAGRARFAHDQEILIDKKRLYETKLSVFPGSMIYPMFGFPKIDLDKIKIIKSQDNAKVFSDGVEGPLKLK